ncbi:MAG: hypothetical protein JWP78_301 [Mucilaginibacter sp.]|nr:hypothetical protein [Mucilaginibacter sp.]
MVTLKNIKSDFRHVFVQGDAKGREQLHVVIILGIPLLLAVIIMLIIFPRFSLV